MKARNLSHEYRMNEQWYGMPPKCRKRYRYELRALRRKERRILNRMVEELVVDELRLLEIERLEAELELLDDEWLDIQAERVTNWSPEVEDVAAEIAAEFKAVFTELATLDY